MGGWGGTQPKRLDIRGLTGLVACNDFLSNELCCSNCSTNLIPNDC